jgi:hypothetical protein
VTFEFSYDEVDWVENILLELGVTVLFQNVVAVFSDTAANQRLDSLFAHA